MHCLSNGNGSYRATETICGRQFYDYCVYMETSCGPEKINYCKDSSSKVIEQPIIGRECKLLMKPDLKMPICLKYQYTDITWTICYCNTTNCNRKCIPQNCTVLPMTVSFEEPVTGSMPSTKTPFLNISIQACGAICIAVKGERKKFTRKIIQTTPIDKNDGALTSQTGSGRTDSLQQPNFLTWIASALLTTISFKKRIEDAPIIRYD